MSATRAVVVDPEAAGKLVIREVGAPSPGPGEAVVKVEAISLNRGETRRALAAAAGWRPGWDLAGVVEAVAPDGSGPAIGARVVGLLPSGAWAERVAVPTHALAELPAEVSFAQAATLPVAGLTALHALDKGGSLLGRSVLITGASGGVGHLAVQLARSSGARVVGLVRQERHAAAVRQAGAHAVAVGSSAAAAAAEGPFDLILESVGGRTLGEALGLLAPDGTCVSFGVSDSSEVTFDAGQFFRTGRTRLYGLYIFQEFGRESAAAGLTRLARLVAAGQLTPRLDVEAPWTEIAPIAQQLMDRRYAGKAVLHLGG